MNKIWKELMAWLNTASQPVHFLLAVGMLTFVLYVAVSFGERLGKALFYLSH